MNVRGWILSAIFAAFAALAVGTPTSATAQSMLWRCDAWPALGAMRFTYTDYDPYYAAEQALGACRANYGDTCSYRCYSF